MTSHKLDNLVKIGQLKAEPGSQSEFDGLLHSAKARLTDARNETLSETTRHLTRLPNQASQVAG